MGFCMFEKLLVVKTARFCDKVLFKDNFQLSLKNCLEPKP